MSEFLNFKLLVNNHFENIGAFQNLINYNLKDGYSYPIIDYKIYKKKCKENCQNVNPIDLEYCNNYCSKFIENIQDSINYSALKCKNKDFGCCIKESNNNPLALYNCLGIKNLKSDKIPSYPNRLLILQIIISFFFICFILLIIIFIIKKTD
jgi:hypothetical protein